MEDVMKATWMIFGIPLLLLVSAVLNGLALSVMWGWFIVPTFSLPQITIVQAIGIGMVVGFLTHQDIDCEPKKEDTNEKLSKAVAHVILRPLMALLFGGILHTFM